MIRRTDEAGLRLVRFLWCGNDGTVRAKASSRHGLEGRLESGIGLTVGMQAMNGLDQLQPVEGDGAGRRDPARPGPEHLPRAAVRAAYGRGADRPRRPRRRAGARVPALVPEADGGPSRRARPRPACRVRERVLARHPGRRALRPDRLRPLLLDDRHDGRAGLRRRAGRPRSRRRKSRSSSTTPSSATVSRRSRRATRPRCGRRTSSSSCARRSAASQPGTASSRRSRRSRGRTTRATAATVHFSLWAGERNRFHDGSAPDLLSADARSFIAGVLEHLPGLCGLDRTELQLVPPARAAVLGRRVRLLGPRQPGGAGARRVGVQRGRRRRRRTPS